MLFQEYGAWTADSNTVGEWIGMDFGMRLTVSGVVTQGRHDQKQWVKQYEVQIAVDDNCDTYEYIRNEDGSIQVLQTIF